MIKVQAICDYCGHHWEAERHGDGALCKFRVGQIDNKTVCNACMQKGAELLIEHNKTQGHEI